MQCLGCFKSIGRGECLSCVKCKGAYHYQCLNITSAFFRGNSLSLKQTWLCPSCSNVTRRKRGENTPVRDTNESVMSCDGTLDELKLTSPSDLGGLKSQAELSLKESLVSPTLADGYRMSYEDFEKLLDSKLRNVENSITQNIKATVRSEVSAAIEKLKTEFSETTEFLSAEQADLKTKITSANKVIKTLENENEKLSKELNNLGGRLSMLEKSSRNCNLEIQCFPEKKQESLLNVLKAICKEIGCPLQDKDISTVRRIAKFDSSSARPRNILVTLASEGLRNNIISSYKSYNKSHKSAPLNSSIFGAQGEKAKIYMVEHLPPETKKLHAEARKTATTLNYKYVWVKYGRVYMRKVEDSDVIYIKNLESLNKLS